MEIFAVSVASPSTLTLYGELRDASVKIEEILSNVSEHGAYLRVKDLEVGKSPYAIVTRKVESGDRRTAVLEETSHEVPVRGVPLAQNRSARVVPLDCRYDSSSLSDATGGVLGADWVCSAIEHMYGAIDLIDSQLSQNGSERISEMVELANLSSMIGNLLGAGLAKYARGLYERNRPHAYPDLLNIFESDSPLELKMALESNAPKAHLPKEGLHMIFRYVLCDVDGQYVKGRENRGVVPWVWEVRVGHLLESDYALSNTDGDSGKTATVRSSSLANMERVIFVPELSPYGLNNQLWGMPAL